MASYTYNSNIVASDPNQYFTLNVTFSEGAFSWNVVSKRQDGATGNVTRNNIYGLTVNIGGNSTYIGDIAWQNYTVGSTLRSGTVQLANCTVTNGAVAVTLTGNYYYGTWNTTYKCSISQSITIASPTVTLDSNYTLTDDYQGQIVGGVTQITFTMSATVGTEGNTISAYRLYVDGVQAYSGTSASGTITAPTSVGTHEVYAMAVESNGATGKSASLTITTVAYTAPTFVSVSSVRWSTGDATGGASDDGTYAKLTPTYTKAKVGTTELTTTCTVTIGSLYTGSTSVSGTSLYTGSVLSDTLSYTVMYTLSDSFSSQTVVRSDTISIGGRGFDMIHGSQGYGSAFGMKATSGQFDTAHPLRVCDVAPSGSITNEALIEATPTARNVTVTRTGGIGLSSYSLHTCGRVAFLTIVLNGSGSYSGGTNLFTGTLSDFRPVSVATGAGFYAGTGFNATLDENGRIVVRMLGTVGFSTEYDSWVSFTYLF